MSERIQEDSYEFRFSKRRQLWVPPRIITQDKIDHPRFTQRLRPLLAGSMLLSAACTIPEVHAQPPTTPSLITSECDGRQIPDPITPSQQDNENDCRALKGLTADLRASARQARGPVADDKATQGLYKKASDRRQVIDRLNKKGAPIGGLLLPEAETNSITVDHQDLAGTDIEKYQHNVPRDFMVLHLDRINGTSEDFLYATSLDYSQKPLFKNETAAKLSPGDTFTLGTEALIGAYVIAAPQIGSNLVVVSSAPVRAASPNNIRNIQVLYGSGYTSTDKQDLINEYSSPTGPSAFNSWSQWTFGREQTSQTTQYPITGTIAMPDSYCSPSGYIDQHNAGVAYLQARGVDLSQINALIHISQQDPNPAKLCNAEGAFTGWGLPVLDAIFQRGRTFWDPKIQLGAPTVAMHEWGHQAYKVNHAGEAHKNGNPLHLDNYLFVEYGLWTQIMGNSWNIQEQPDKLMLAQMGLYSDSQITVAIDKGKFDLNCSPQGTTYPQLLVWAINNQTSATNYAAMCETSTLRPPGYAKLYVVSGFGVHELYTKNHLHDLSGDEFNNTQPDGIAQVPDADLQYIKVSDLGDHVKVTLGRTLADMQDPSPTPTNSPIPATATFTQVPPTATWTPLPPTATFTVIPSATWTPVVAPTSTPESTPTFTSTPVTSSTPTSTATMTATATQVRPSATPTQIEQATFTATSTSNPAPSATWTPARPTETLVPIGKKTPSGGTLLIPVAFVNRTTGW